MRDPSGPQSERGSGVVSIAEVHGEVLRYGGRSFKLTSRSQCLTVGHYLNTYPYKDMKNVTLRSWAEVVAQSIKRHTNIMTRVQSPEPT